MFRHYCVICSDFCSSYGKYNENNLNALTRSKILSENMLHLKMGARFLLEMLFTDGENNKS